MQPVNIVSIRGHREVPYRFTDQLHKELQAAGVRRVVFATPISLKIPAPQGLQALLEEGEAVVLPREGEALEDVQVSIKNILHLLVQPSGLVDVKRGASDQVQQFRPRDIEALWLQEVAPNPNLIAAVKTHPDASYRFMAEVLEALHAAGAERISLQVQRD